MAEHADASGSLALSRRPRGAVRTLPKPMAAPSAFSAAKVLAPNSAEPAEIAQARVFEQLLHAECTELRELARRVAADQQSDTDDSGLHGDLGQISARIDEVDGLLRALQGRFPRSAPDDDR